MRPDHVEDAEIRSQMRARLQDMENDAPTKLTDFVPISHINREFSILFPVILGPNLVTKFGFKKFHIPNIYVLPSHMVTY